MNNTYDRILNLVVEHDLINESPALLAPLVSTAVRVGGSALLRKGAVVGGRKAATGSITRKLAMGARKLGKDPKKMKAAGDFIGNEVSTRMQNRKAQEEDS